MEEKLGKIFSLNRERQRIENSEQRVKDLGKKCESRTHMVRITEGKRNRENETSFEGTLANFLKLMRHQAIDWRSPTNLEQNKCVSFWLAFYLFLFFKLKHSWVSCVEHGDSVFL